MSESVQNAVVVGVMVAQLCALVTVVWLVRDLTLGFQTFVDWHMRVQVELHKEMCQMNDRFRPVGSGGPPPSPSPDRALEALRGGGRKA